MIGVTDRRAPETQPSELHAAGSRDRSHRHATPESNIPNIPLFLNTESIKLLIILFQMAEQD